MKIYKLQPTETSLMDLVNKDSRTYNFITSVAGHEHIPLKFISCLSHFSKDNIVTVVKTLTGIEMLLKPDTADGKIAVAISTKNESLKDLISALLETELGSEACCKLEADSLKTPFGLSGIEGKQLAIISDTAHGIISPELISTLITQESIIVEVKYKNPYRIKNKAGLLILTNKPLMLTGSKYNVRKANSKVLKCRFTEGDNDVLSTSEIYNIIEEEREDIIALAHTMSKVFEAVYLSAKANV